MIYNESTGEYFEEFYDELSDEVYPDERLMQSDAEKLSQIEEEILRVSAAYKNK